MSDQAALSETVSFVKMQGCGNDFVMIDNRDLAAPVAVMADWARTLCRRAFGIGADGLIFLDAAPAGGPADYVWHFHNADGSRAEMCGNGARCAARLAHLIGLAPARHVLGTDAGEIAAEVFPETGEVEVRLTTPRDLTTDIELEADGRRLTVHFVNTGVPHCVIPVPEPADVDVKALGRAVRFHPRFAPAGTNVNFIRVVDRKNLDLRTYERGVEDETYACGTGAVASVVVARALGLVGDAAWATTTGGERLGVRLSGENAHLRGAAAITFRGEFRPADLGLA